MRIIRNEPLKKHTSFRIGGRAEYFCQPKSVAELQAAIAFARENKLGISLLGAGTNLLVLDQGVKGLVIKLAGGLDKLQISGPEVTVGAGVLLPRLLVKMAGKGWGGLEFLAGVPGSVGGAVVMNAGAWGKDLGQSVKQVKALDRQGRERSFSRSSLKFGYRKCLLQRSKWIVTEAVIKLKKKSPRLIKQQMADFIAQRRKGQPLGAPNCGSVFKNPAGDHAGRLIEAAGCKGWRIGDAQVSSKHANFIVNLGEARANDVIRLITKIRRAVKERFNITLEPELKIMVKSTL
jgi:UDP-N-acetylmuramate dehydrogenase